MVVFLLNVLMSWRVNGHLTSAVPFALEVIEVVPGAVTGRLGAELVDRLGVEVDAGANLNAPSSPSGQPATATGVTTTPQGEQAM